MTTPADAWWDGLSDDRRAQIHRWMTPTVDVLVVPEGQVSIEELLPRGDDQPCGGAQ